MEYKNGYSKNQKKGYKNDRKKNSDKPHYTGAPYNFIPIPEHVVKNYDSPAKLPAHNQIQNTLFSGEITFTLTAETPVFVGGAESDAGGRQYFYKTISGKYAIPGSSIKGLIRSNMQILGMGSIAEDVEDFKLMYRTVGNARSRRTDNYKDILGVKTITLPKGGQVTLPTNVQAGYIYKENGKYYIKEAVGKPIDPQTYGKLNYYSVSEKNILVDDKEEKQYKLDRSKLQNQSFYTKWNDRSNKKEWKGEPNRDYYPYFIPVYYKAKEGAKTASYIYDPKYCSQIPGDCKKGILISTGPMNNKKHLYIIPEMSDQEGTQIAAADILSYQRDYEMKKNGLHGTKLKDPEKKELAREFFKLPEEGKIKPVFYIRLGSKTYFGFTPYLRLFYNHSLQDGLPAEQKKKDVDGVDYARSILGFSEQVYSYKSRVSFEDAPLENKKGERSVNVVLGEPKMTSYLDYLKQEREDNQETTYNDDFAFRGIKQYWLHEEVLHEKTGTENTKVSSAFQALDTGSCFCEKIHFKNLRKEELGLLLWCIYQGEAYQWNIGKAKAYGYGRMAVSKPIIKLYDPAKMYAPILSLDVYHDEKTDIDEFITAYQTELREYLCEHQLGLKHKLSDNKDLENLPGIKEFLLMKNNGRRPAPARIQYMSINDGDYQNRTQALPTVEEVLAGKEGKRIEKPTGKNGRKKGGSGNKNNYQDNRSRDGSNNRYQNRGSGKTTTVMTETKGDIIEAEFIKVDNRKNELIVKVAGKEEHIQSDAFKLLTYSGYKKGQKIKVKKVKQKNKKPTYELADQEQ